VTLLFVGGRQRPLRFVDKSVTALRTSCPRASGTRRRARGGGYEGRDGVAESEEDRMMRELGNVINKIQTRAVCVVKPGGANQHGAQKEVERTTTVTTPKSG